MENTAEIIMSAEEATYKGKKIEIKKEESEEKLYIDGKLCKTDYDDTTKTYSCDTFAYASFKNLKELGEAVVDTL